MSAPLPAGYGVMAEAFGDFVYLHADVLTMCPSCSTPAQLTRLSRCYLMCTQCGFWEPCALIDAAQRWVVFPTELFVNTSRRKRFYLPTAWNNTNPWIEREQLEEKYNKYLMEKKECLDRMQVESAA
jgi:hypothetical protein